MTPRVGYYGKLPCRGDFLRGALPRAVAAGWDGWMETVLAPAQFRLGGAWRTAWATLPPWRFAIGPGLCGDAPVSGVWLASADRVGRPFPFVLAAVAGTPTDAFLGAVEGAATAAVAGDLAPEDLAHWLRRHLRSSAFEDAPDLGLGTRTRWWRGQRRSPEHTLDVLGWPDAEAFTKMVKS